VTAQSSETVIRRQPRRPNGTGRKTARSFKTEDELWNAALAAAHRKGISLGSVLNRALEELVAEDETDA
jgi:predicted HicB family RNase H-like nuclease